MTLMLMYVQVTRIEKILKSIQDEIVKIYAKLLDTGTGQEGQDGVSSGIEDKAKCIEDFLNDVKDKIANGHFNYDHHNHEQEQMELTSDILDFDNFTDFQDLDNDTTTPSSDGIISISHEVKPDVHSISTNQQLVQECLIKRPIVLLGRLPIVENCANSREKRYSLRNKRSKSSKENRTENAYEMSQNDQLYETELELDKAEESEVNLSLSYCKNDKDKLRCLLCKRKYTFISEDKLKIHHLRCHSKMKKPFQCTIGKCTGEFYSQKEIVQHRDQMHSDCSKCKLKFRTRKELIKHLKVDHKNEILKCALCNKKYTNKKGLDYHYKVVHKLGFESIKKLRTNRKNQISKERSIKVNLSTWKESESEESEDNASVDDPDQINQEMEQIRTLSSQDKITAIQTQKDQENESITSESDGKPLNFCKKVGHNKFKCILCKSSNRFTTLSVFENHYQRVHTKWKDPSKCRIDGCFRSFYSKKDMNIHKNQDHSYCSHPECCRKFSTRREYINHSKQLHKNNNFSCSVCGKIYIVERALVAHYSYIHSIKINLSSNDVKLSAEREYRECEFGNFENVHEIQNPEDNDRTQQSKACEEQVDKFEYTCSLCPMTFPLKVNKIAHFKIVHLNQKPISRPQRDKSHFVSCDIENCGQWMSEKNLEFHKFTHDIPDFEFYWKELTCGVCRQICANNSSLKAHIMAQHHPSKKRYNCSVCDKSYNYQQSLDHHVKSHSATYRCTIPGCNMSFNLEGTLRLHLRRRHGNMKCPHENCDFRFTTQRSYDIHIENYHGEKVICPFCSKLLLKCRVNSHNWRVHREFKCNIDGCTQVFNKEVAFKQHQAEHDPEINPEFLCTVCGVRKWTKYCLRKHFRTFHVLQLKCPFEGCSCTRVFSRKSNLNDHIKTHERNIKKNMNKK